MKLCRQPSDFFHWRSHLQTLMRSERVVQVDGLSQAKEQPPPTLKGENVRRQVGNI